VQSRLLLDVVIGQRAAVLELLAREDEALLVRRNSVRGQYVIRHDLSPSSATYPSLSWILLLTLSIVSELSTSRVMVLPVSVFTKICMADSKNYGVAREVVVVVGFQLVASVCQRCGAYKSSGSMFRLSARPGSGIFFDVVASGAALDVAKGRRVIGIGAEVQNALFAFMCSRCFLRTLDSGIRPSENVVPQVPSSLQLKPVFPTEGGLPRLLILVTTKHFKLTHIPS